jgi:F1F0 ATPase subunit 2
MSDVTGAWALGLAFAGGVVAAAFYFGTLWFFVRRLDRLTWPAAWLGVTGILRLVVVLAIFAALAGSRWERWLAALAGFLALRIALMRWLGRSAAAPVPPGRGQVATREGT